jgi:outer membrane protein TolC
LPNSREALDLARDGFSRGIIPTASFLQAQRTFVETYLAFIDLQEDVWKTAADLSRLLQMDEFP